MSKKKRTILLTTEEYERLQILKYKIKHSNSLSYMKNLHEKINRLLIKGERRALEEKIKRSKSGRVNLNDLYDDKSE